MSLEPAHEWIARVALGLPEAPHLALAGGGAMLAHGLVQRPTRDVDLFTPVEAEVDPLVGALTEALRDRGGEVEVERRGATFARLLVTTPDGAAVAVEVGQDARIRNTVQLSFGRVLHPDEVAADKVLALFGRAAARDLVDVAALRDRYSLPRCRHESILPGRSSPPPLQRRSTSALGWGRPVAGPVMAGPPGC